MSLPPSNAEGSTSFGQLHEGNFDDCLPAYQPSSSTPSYSVSPQPDERRLALTACHVGFRRYTPTSTLEKQNKRHGITLQLTGQDEGTKVPVYGREATIEGQVLLADPSKVHSVSLKLEGRLDATIADGGTRSMTVLHMVHTLWSHQDLCEDLCPSVLPFDFPLPATYADQDGQRNLPPSYDFTAPGIPGLYIRSSYSLSVVTKRKRRLLWKSTQRLKITIKYYPRMRPSRPVIQTSIPFLHAVKIAAEEYHQVTAVMESRVRSNIASIHCSLFIPIAQVYGIKETIPFHLQLTAPQASLDALLPSDGGQRPSLSRTTSYFAHHSEPHRTVRVYLLRQVRADVRGQRVWRTRVLGEGSLVQAVLTPSTREGKDDAQRISMDWDGTVRVADNVDVGGFAAGTLLVKDFIILELTPENPPRSPLLVLQHAHPVRFVTDPFEEIWEAAPNDTET